jgi:hypothetical protein
VSSPLISPLISLRTSRPWSAPGIPDICYGS